jgi:hypothetical protein
MKKLFCALALLCLTSVSCGYTLAGRGSFLPTYIKTIGIPNFTNHTTIFNFETQLTQKVRTEFIGRGKYQIVPEDTGVDAVLIGDILSATVVPTSVTTAPGQAPLAQGNSVTVTARVVLRSLHDDTVIWQNPAMSFRQDYPAQNASSVTDPNAFFGQNANALDRMSSDFARTIVSAILEAF